MENLAELLLDNLFDGVYCMDLEGRITFWNKGAERISGYSREEMLGRSCSENLLRHIDGQGHSLCDHGCPMRATLIDRQPRQADVFLHHKKGHRMAVSVRVTPILDEAGTFLGAVEVFSDNSHKESLMRQLEEAREESYIDPLTRVGNRRFAEYFLSRRFVEYQEARVHFGVLFIDLDNFKQLNDTYGHVLGDRVLVMVAATIKNSLRSLDAVTRWGGEEFLVIAVNLNREGLTGLADRIRRFIAESWISVGKGVIRVTASVGGALYHGGESIEELIQRADGLMYAAKNSGRNRICMESLDGPAHEE